MPKNDLVRALIAKTSNDKITSTLDRLFAMEKGHHEERTGLHGSGMIVSENDWCYREHILSYFYKKNETPISNGLRRIFLNGHYVHDKWQRLFKEAGISVAIEARCFSEEWDLYSTPDAIVQLNNKLYVVEIKSMNSFSYRLSDTHPSGAKQCSFYMHLYGIPNGFVLMENKDTQEFRIQMVDYDPHKVRPFVERLYWIKGYVKKFKEEKRIPPKICKNETCKRAKNCSMREACFGIRREKL